MEDERKSRQFQGETERRGEQAGPEHEPDGVRQRRHGERRGDAGLTPPAGGGEQDDGPRGERELPAATPEPVETSRLAFVHPTGCAMLTEISRDTPGSSIVMP